jgi:ribokinase
MLIREHCNIVVVGGVNTDYLVKGERLPAPGETLQGEVFQHAMGGKGANKAVAVVRLGCRASLIARVGADDRGENALDQLATEGVDVEHVRRDESVPTGAALILVDRSGERQIFAALGANRRLTETDVDAAKETIASANVLVAQFEVPVPAVVHALRLARAAGVRTILDPAPAVPLSEDVLQLVDFIRPNAAEAEVLTGIAVHDRRSAARAARILLNRGVRAAVVQAGAEGDLLVTRDEEQFLPRIPVDRIDPTGAGDAFVAALAVALAEDRPLTAAAILANAAAALATTALGAHAGLPRQADVMRFLVGSQREHLLDDRSFHS